MGWVRNAKSDALAREAGKARANGQQVFAVKLNYPGSKADFSGEVADWSAMIEAVESQGWALCHFAGAADTKGRPEALCVFRPR